MKQEPLPQIHLVHDTDLGIFAYELHILAGDFQRESEFNLRSLAANTGPDSIAVMGKKHIWLADALSAYYPTGELYRMAAMTEYPGARAFLFHTEYYPPWEPPVSRFRATRKWYFPPSEPPQHIVAAHMG